MAIFLVDSNFFIEAHRATYPLDIATGFWAKVKLLAAEGIIQSIDKVKMELYDKNDDLEAWCRENLPDDFFNDSSQSIAEYSKVTQWAIKMNNHYLPAAISEFLDAEEADAFIIAFALQDIKNIIVVTQEVSRPERKNKIKIPEPCNAFGIKYINTIEMFRILGQTF